jgi:CrcB protein
MTKVILVFIGGGFGSAARYGTTLLATRLFGSAFPWGTLAVNLIGCLLIGVLFGVSDWGAVNPQTRLLLMTGFLGGLTTFSTYALETSGFARSEQLTGAVSNLVANNGAGLALVFAGFWLAQKLAPGS